MKMRNVWLLFGVAIIFAASVHAAENETVNTVLNVTGNPPNTTVFLDEAGDLGVDNSITLVENSTQLVSCWGTAEDLDGLGDLFNLTAYVFAESSAWDAASNTSVRYINDSCSNSWPASGDWNCTFDVPYFAENSTWTCMVNVTDIGGASTFNTNNDTARIEDLLSLSVNTTLIDFGTKPVDVNDTVTDTPAVVFNLGNVEIDLQLDAWERNDSGNVNSASSFNCSVGEIPVEYLKFGLTSADAYAGATAMSAVGQTGTIQFDLEHQVGGSGTTLPTFSTSYWGIGVPAATGGVCQGQVRYIGIASD
jgi:hypothetical protein